MFVIKRVFNNIGTVIHISKTYTEKREKNSPKFRAIKITRTKFGSKNLLVIQKIRNIYSIKLTVKNKSFIIRKQNYCIQI